MKLLTEGVMSIYHSLLQAETEILDQTAALEAEAATAANTAANAVGRSVSNAVAGSKDKGNIEAFRLLRAKKVLLALSKTGNEGSDSD